MEYWVFGILFIAVIAGKAIYDIVNNKRNALKEAEKTFGKFNAEGMTYDEMEITKGYFRKRPKNDSFVIDDITANDVALDEIFASINTTSSAAGAESLYAILRTPCFSKEEMEERERLISLFQKDRPLAVNLKVFFSKLKKNNKISMYEAINIFDSVKIDDLFTHYLCTLLLIAAVAFTFYNRGFGILALIAVLSYNIISYFMSKSKLSFLLYGLKNTIMLIDAGNRIVKLNNSDLGKYNAEIDQDVKKLSRLKRAGFAVNTNVSGDLASIVMDYLNMIFHIDLISLSKAVKCAEKETPAINRLYENLGFLDAMITVASLRTATDRVCIPVLTEEGTPFVSFREANHPMLSKPVPVSLDGEKGILITGSNASGKSTFLKTVALNAIFAETIHTCFAKEYSSSYFRVYSSMALSDDLVAGESYYITEIKALKRIMDDDCSVPSMCFIDEVLRGTNTVERIAASTAALEYLAKQNRVVFAATHDIELTTLLSETFTNYHFEEGLDEDGNIYFDYILKNGASETKNAILMLKAYNYEDGIIEAAKHLAEGFTNTGKWNR